MPRGVPQIEVTFDVNSDGIMHIFAVETSSGKSEKITIKNDRGNLSADDIARMVAEAEKHAEEDAKAQGVIQARNDLHEFAYAVMHALRDEAVATEVGDDNAEEIADLVTDAIDWLDEHEDHSTCTEEEVREQKDKLAGELKGFLGILGVSTDAKKVVMGPTVHSTDGTKPASGPGNSTGTGADQPTKRKTPDSGPSAGAATPKTVGGYLRGPNGCIIVDVDDYD